MQSSCWDMNTAVSAMAQTPAHCCFSGAEGIPLRKHGGCRWRDEQYSYREVDAASTELAQHLVALGAGPDVVIGLLMERCPQIYVAMLGIMKAGAAHVPLDPAYPPERIAFMLEDTAAPLLVTHRGFEGRLASTAALRVRRARAYWSI